MQLHGVCAGLPVIEITDDTDSPGIGGPDRKTHTFGAFMGHGMCAKHIIDMPVPAFGQQVEVELAQGGAFHSPRVPVQNGTAGG